jgi:hypothetical protein
LSSKFNTKALATQNSSETPGQMRSTFRLF